MPRYLSDEWLRALDEAARDCTVPGNITIEHVVRDGADDGGEVRYHVVVAGARVRFVGGPAPRPTVTFHEDRATAIAIAKGELSAPAAFLSGRLSVGGDLRALTANTSAVAAVDAAVAAFKAGGPAAAVPYAGWNTAERIRFLNSLPKETARDRLAALDDAFLLSGSGNAEILFAWLKHAIASRYEPAVPAAERFLTSMGRRKFVQPLFETLMAQGEWGRPIARRIYGKTRSGYHAVTQGSVDKVVLKGG